MATTSPLRQRMIEDVMIRNLSRAAQQSYVYAFARFSRHFNSSPDRLGMEEVRAYQLHLGAKNHSWSAHQPSRMRLAVLLCVTLGQKEAFERIVFGREPEKLPAVLNAEEVVRFWKRLRDCAIVSR
jgi:integrase/recombinase XerD